MKVQAIIPAAGLGTRLQQKEPKSLVPIRGVPILLHVLFVFEKSPAIDSVVVVAPVDSQKLFQKLVKNGDFKKVKKIIPGGETRMDSVFQGLQATDEDTDMVVIHDAARPLISVGMIQRAVEEGQKSGAVVVAVPVKSTIKRVDAQQKMVLETLNRSELWEIQTPQVFKREILLRAYQNRKKGEPSTDDASLVEALGVPVKIVEGDYRNIKITTQEDIAVAEALL
jgi:2-C-methyl-D-erythritol 4-phosphate cytidylyltransferase